jgi:ribosomal protein L31
MMPMIKGMTFKHKETGREVEIISTAGDMLIAMDENGNLHPFNASQFCSLFKHTEVKNDRKPKKR